MLYRIRSWRTDLYSWAARVRRLPYVWGQTDCMALAREALKVQFGRELFPALPILSGPLAAVELFRSTVIADLFHAIGAAPLVLRPRGIWPTGAVLLSQEQTGMPAFGIYIHRFIVASSLEHGVQWIEPRTFDVHAAWLVQEANS